MNRSRSLTILNAVLLSAALVLALVPLRPSPQASVEDHGSWMLRWWIPSVTLFTFGVLGQRRRRRVVLVLACLVYLVVFVEHPVCDLIPPERQKDFETVRSLEERARQGEPFSHLEGKWYQCKSWLARQLFF
jgi:hypothetical protein